MAALLIAAITFFTLVYFLQGILSFSDLKVHANQILHYVEQNRLRGMLIFALLYYVACAVPFPFVSVLTIMSGFLFGTVAALLITSFASTLGASTLFLVTRHFFASSVQTRLIQRFPILHTSAESNDFWLAFSLRLVPGMPFFVPSMALGLTKLSLAKFYGSTQLGLFLTIFAFVNAGSHLSTINSVSDVFSAPLIMSMLLIAILPLMFKALSSKLPFIKNDE